MSKKRRQYSDDFRADCVLMLEAAGYPDRKGALTVVSKKVKVPLRTLSRWFNREQNPPPDQLVNEKRGEMSDRLESIQHIILDEMEKAVKGAPLRELATAYGVTFDKRQLLNDKPTAILKLEQAVKDGLITPDQIRERYPSIADQYFANVDR